MMADVRSSSAEGGTVAKQGRGGEVHRRKGSVICVRSICARGRFHAFQRRRLLHAISHPVNITCCRFTLNTRCTIYGQEVAALVSLKQVISPRHFQTTVQAGESFVILNFSAKFCSRLESNVVQSSLGLILCPQRMRPN